jgi:hypothetical protein
MGFSVAASLLLIAPPYIVTIFVTLYTSHRADRSHYRIPYIVILSLTSMVGFGLLAAPLPKAIKVIGIFLAVAGANANQPTVIAFAQNNIITTSKRAVASALQIGLGAIGGIAASTVFRQQDAPRYVPGYDLIITN